MPAFVDQDAACSSNKCGRLHIPSWVLIAFQNAFRHLAIGTPIEDALIETVSEAAIPTPTLRSADAASRRAGAGGYPGARVLGSPGLSPAR